MSLITVEVAYALPDRQSLLKLQVPEGSNMVEAVERSGICELYPEIDPATANMGIFGRVVPKPADEILREGDRVEIYRPLLIDPKQARANRARKGSAS